MTYKVQDGSMILLKTFMLYSDIAENTLSDEERGKINGFSDSLDENIDKFDHVYNVTKRNARGLNDLIASSREFVEKEQEIQKAIEKIAEECYNNVPSLRSKNNSPEKPQQSPSGMGYFTK